MKESQITEWKESWRDEYVKWIFGFANSDGGTLVIALDKLRLREAVLNASSQRAEARAGLTQNFKWKQRAFG